MIKYTKRLILFPIGVWGNTVFSGYIYALTNSSVQVYICCRLRGDSSLIFFAFSTGWLKWGGSWNRAPCRSIGIRFLSWSRRWLDIETLKRVKYESEHDSWYMKCWCTYMTEKSVAQFFCQSLSFFNQQVFLLLEWVIRALRKAGSQLGYLRRSWIGCICCRHFIFGIRCYEYTNTAFRILSYLSTHCKS